MTATILCESQAVTSRILIESKYFEVPASRLIFVGTLRSQLHSLSFDMSIFRLLLKTFRIRFQSKKGNIQRHIQTFTVSYHSIPDTESVKEEYCGGYFCPGCNEQITIYRQCTSDLSTSPCEPKITHDILRFEQNSRSTSARKVFCLPVDYKAQISQARSRFRAFTQGRSYEDVVYMADRLGEQFELLSETCLGYVTCGNCKKGLHFWSQVRRLNDGKELRWELARKSSREEKCHLKKAEHAQVKLQARRVDYEFGSRIELEDFQYSMHSMSD